MVTTFSKKPIFGYRNGVRYAVYWSSRIRGMGLQRWAPCYINNNVKFCYMLELLAMFSVRYSIKN